MTYVVIFLCSTIVLILIFWKQTKKSKTRKDRVVRTIMEDKKKRKRAIWVEDCIGRERDQI